MVIAILILGNNSPSLGADLVDSTAARRPAPRFGKSEVTTFDATVVSRSKGSVAERCFVQTDLPKILADAFVDNAELILVVSAVCDTSEPLIIAAFPATQPVGTRSVTWSESWGEMSGGFDPEYIAISTVESTAEEIEIRLDVTQFVRLWQTGALANHGVVIKALTEGKSSFQWIRDGRYEGGDAKLVTLYTADKR
jgi:hypothetical protein